jgi:alpha-L-arabinofuranosidase
MQLLVVNRDETEPTDTKIILRDFRPKEHVETLTLNGPSALSHNDVTNRAPAYHSFPNVPEPVVKLTRSTWMGAQESFRYSFPAHSVTVLRLERK